MAIQKYKRCSTLSRRRPSSLVYRIHFLSACTTHFLVSTHCALQGSRLKTQALDKVVSASFIVIPHAHVSSSVFDVVAQRHVCSVPVAPLFILCSLIHNVNVTSEPHKKSVSNSKRTHLSLEGVWPNDRFRSNHNKNVWECIKGWLQLDGGKCRGENWLRNGIQWCSISVVRGQRGLQLPIEFVCL